MGLAIFSAIVQIALKLLMYFLDPDRLKREALEKKKEADQNERDEYAKALADGDLLTASYHLDRVLREAKANRASGKQDS